MVTRPSHDRTPHCSKNSTLLQFFDRAVADMLANQCNQHCIYFLSADHIGHHLVFETYHGKTRIFQCSVKSRVSWTGGLEGDTVGYQSAGARQPQCFTRCAGTLQLNGLQLNLSLRGTPR
jgi:hypothetical protein